MRTQKKGGLALAMAIGAGLCGCATAPDSLRTPGRVTCIDLPATIASSDTSGIMYTWDTRIERGTYYAERDDDQGTYFRGPPGAIYRGVRGAEQKPPGLVTHLSRDGGLHVPRDPSRSPQPYIYSAASNDDIPVQRQIAGTSCSNVAYVQDGAQRITGLVAADSGRRILLQAADDPAAGESATTTMPTSGIVAIAVVVLAEAADKDKVSKGTIPLDEASLATLKPLLARPVLINAESHPAPGSAR
jgi:hypothetical protein